MTRPLKIMHIVSRLNIGGVAVHVSLLASHLANAGHEVTLLSGSVSEGEGDMSYYAKERDVTPVIIPELGRDLHPLRDIRTLWKLYRLIRQEKPDVIHTHTAKAGFAGRWAAKFAGVPVIIHTYHGHVFSGYFSPAKTKFFIWLERVTGHISTHLVTLTESLRQDLAVKYHIAPIDKISSISLGFDFTPFTRVQRKNGAFRKAYGIPEAVPLVGISGRMVPIKNHALFLEAAAMVREAIPDVHFVMVGDGELRAQIEVQAAALGLTDVLHITGWLNDVADSYADMGVFVISSLNEGTPVTVIESLVVGCPVVATDVGGLRDLLDNGRYGQLVPSGDAPAMAAAIRDTLANPPDPSIAREAMHSGYSIQRLSADIMHLYKTLLQNSA